ncbi:arginase family protein [Glaciihabitans arcticus]|uniref:Arginase family protein n=1 Tax=Glaciihabitans arcticus TaxID=2668039 RepID=A0A4Q9H123_9MICO|nr:arginase family protein [Glaciihabitans arcticus]TBN58420.1 arginase family protein [Glaciihabitans arcticus]
MSAPGLTVFQGLAGDRNVRGWEGAAALGAELATRLATDVVTVGTRGTPIGADWRTELDAASDGFRSLAERYVEVFEGGRRPITALNRCAAAIATLPIVARYRPDAVVVWFDGHADINLPGHPDTWYLGGIAFSASLGLWDSGFGAGVSADRAILVGARDIDPPEQELIAGGAVQLVAPEDLEAAIAGRPVYVHIDCDVLEPGQVATEYRVADGFTLDELGELCGILARTELVGLEVAELESAADATKLADALQPLLALH